MEKSKCTLSVETKTLLSRYFAAAANLYGIIRVCDLLKIYNWQNEPITEEEFLSFIDEIDFSDKYYCVFTQDEIYKDGSETPPLEREIIAEYLCCFDFDDQDIEEYEKLKVSRWGRKFYVPNKEQFLRYEDDEYFQKTPDYLELRSFLRNETGLSKENADDYANGIMICLVTQPDNSFDSVYDAIQLSGIYNRKDIAFNHDRFENLCQNVMRTSVRLHALCAHTPEEVFG